MRQYIFVQRKHARKHTHTHKHKHVHIFMLSHQISGSESEQIMSPNAHAHKHGTREMTARRFISVIKYGSAFMYFDG